MPLPKLPTISGIQRALACPPSVVLPQAGHATEDAERGTAIHLFLSTAAARGREEALGEVPEDYRAVCQAIPLDQLPVGPEYLAELAVAYDVKTDKGRVLGQHLDRAYDVGPDEIAGTIDVAAVLEDRVLVIDYKTGRGKVTSAARNWQLKVGALALARAHGKTRATVGLIYLSEDGAPWWDQADLEAFDMDMDASFLRVLVDQIANEQESLDHGEPERLRLNLGEHCRYCPAIASCPAQTALVRRATGDPAGLASELKALLTPATAAKAYERMQQVRLALKEVDSALYAFATEHPISLSDGRVFGPVETVRESLDGAATFEVMRGLHGLEAASAACTFEASKASVERALKTVAKATKRTLAELKREALKDVEQVGGIRRKVTISVKEHREVEALPE